MTTASDTAPVDLTPFGNELAIKWADGREDFISLKRLRERCPCAVCAGEGDLLGHTKPERNYQDSSFVLSRMQVVGGYALQPFWADGHSTGLYSWKYLRKICEEESRADG